MTWWRRVKIDQALTISPVNAGKVCPDEATGRVSQGRAHRPWRRPTIPAGYFRARSIGNFCPQPLLQSQQRGAMVNSEGQSSQRAQPGTAERSLPASTVLPNDHEIAAGQKLMVWSMVAWVIGFFPPAVFVTIPFQLYAVFRLTRALRLSGPMIALLMLAVLVPIFCGLVFVGLYVKAGRTLRCAALAPS